MMAAPIIWFMVMFVGWTAKAYLSKWTGLRYGGEAVILFGVGFYMLLSFILFKRDPNRSTWIAKCLFPLDDADAIMIGIGGVIFLLLSLYIVFRSALN